MHASRGSYAKYMPGVCLQISARRFVTSSRPTTLSTHSTPWGSSLKISYVESTGPHSKMDKCWARHRLALPRPMTPGSGCVRPRAFRATLAAGPQRQLLHGPISVRVEHKTRQQVSQHKIQTPRRRHRGGPIFGSDSVHGGAYGLPDHAELPSNLCLTQPTLQHLYGLEASFL
jgi:hypothetical protein